MELTNVDGAVKTKRSYTEESYRLSSDWFVGAASPHHVGQPSDLWRPRGERCGCVEDGPEAKVEHECSCSQVLRSVERLRVLERMGVESRAERRKAASITGWSAAQNNDWAKVSAAQPGLRSSSQGGLDLGDDYPCVGAASWPESFTVDDPTGGDRECRVDVQFSASASEKRRINRVIETDRGSYHETVFICVRTVRWTAQLICDCEVVAGWSDSGWTDPPDPTGGATGQADACPGGDCDDALAASTVDDDGDDTAHRRTPKAISASGGGAATGAHQAQAMSDCVGGGITISTGSYTDELVTSETSTPVRDASQLRDLGGGFISHDPPIVDDDGIIWFRTLEDFFRWAAETGFADNVLAAGQPGVPVWRGTHGFTGFPPRNGEFVGWFGWAAGQPLRQPPVTINQLERQAYEDELRQEALMILLAFHGFDLFQESSAGDSAQEEMDDVGFVEGLVPLYGTYRMYATGHWFWGSVSLFGDATLVFGFGAALKAAAWSARAGELAAKAVTASLPRRLLPGVSSSMFVRSVGRFLWDPRKYKVVSSWLSKQGIGRARGFLRQWNIQIEMHHWLLRQSASHLPAGLRNAGWNLVPLPRWLNQGMNNLTMRTTSRWAPALGRAAEAGVAGAVYTTARGSVWLPTYTGYGGWER